MASMVMSMDMGTATATAAAATSTAMSMGDMDMGGGGCKISMLWNWYTIDSCFVASSWHIRSSGMFAGSCIGVILLVMSLEFLRRASKEYERYIVRQAGMKAKLRDQTSSSSSVKALDASPAPAASPVAFATARTAQFRPSFVQQIVRALLHMVQFAVAYFIMLLAMYYNGYIIISIIIGAFLGAFVFSWESISLGESKEEVTFCCG